MDRCCCWCATGEEHVKARRAALHAEDMDRARVESDRRKFASEAGLSVPAAPEMYDEYPPDTVSTVPYVSEWIQMGSAWGVTACSIALIVNRSILYWH